MPWPSADPAPHLARVIVVLACAALASSQVFRAVSRSSGQLPATFLVMTATIAVLVLQFRYVAIRPWSVRFGRLESGRLESGRLESWKLGSGQLSIVQALLCVAAGLPFGPTAGLTSIAVAALLLDGRWIPAALTVCVLAGVDVEQTVSAPDSINFVLTSALGGTLVYSLTRSATLVSTVHAARVSLAAVAVSAERLRIAASVQSAIAGNLVAIHELAASNDAVEVVSMTRQSLASARTAATDLRSLSLAPETASAKVLLTAAGIESAVDVGHLEPLGGAGTVLAAVLRGAVTEVVRQGSARQCWITTTEIAGQIVLCVSNDGVRTADQSLEQLAPLAERVSAAGGQMTAGLDSSGRFTVEASVPATRQQETGPTEPEYRLGLRLFGVALAAFCIAALLYVPLVWYPVAIGCLAVIWAVQVRYSLRDTKRGRWLGFAITAVIAFVPLDWFGRDWIGVSGFLVGSLLLALPLRFSAPLTVAVMTLAGVITGSAEHSTAEGLDAGFSALITGLLVFGLLRFPRLLRELHEADRRLADAVTVRERLRVARDLHDLLGHNLAAILLKGELAKRLAQRDPQRASAQLQEIMELTQKAEEELRTVFGGDSALTFETELVSAMAVLKAADIDAEIQTPGRPESPSALLAVEVSAAFGVVLREAVTNVLRHSSARHCRIALTAGEGIARLEVANDGVSGEVTSPGSGIGNLSVRLAELGGTLRASARDGWYLLCAEIEPPAQSDS